MLFISVVSFAQLKKVETVKSVEIGKVGPWGMPKTIDCKKAGNTYTFEYKDYVYPDIDAYKTFSFEDIDNTFEELYKVFVEGFNTIPEEAVTLELPDYLLSLKFSKAMGTKSVVIYTTPINSGVVGHTAVLSPKQIDKLFGKKN